MKRLTTSVPPSQDRIRRHRRFAALCSVCTLAGVAAVLLAALGSSPQDAPEPVTAPVVSVAVTAPTPQPAVAPELLQFAKLAQATAPAPPALPARPAITIEPDRNTPDFVPTPPTPAETRAAATGQPRRQAAQPAAIARKPREEPATAANLAVNVQYHKLDQALQQVVTEDPATPVRVIVRTAPGMHATTAAWLGDAGRQVHSLHAQLDGVTATLSASDVAVLSEDRSIVRMSIDAVVRATAEPTPGAVLRETLGLKVNGGVISGDKKWKGRGIRVAVVDSGIEPSDDLDRRRIRYFYDFTNGGVATKPYDDYGHGTHVAGLIGGKGKLSDDEYEGPAASAKFIGIKVLDGDGGGYTSDVLAGLEYMINNNKKLKVDVINMSLGHPIFEPAATDPLVQAVQQAVAEGIVVVVSAGNLGMHPETGAVGYAGITSPGNAPSAITVGAVDLHYTGYRADDTVGPYSSRGPTWYDAFAKPDLVAPGSAGGGRRARELALPEQPEPARRRDDPE